ncbi:universal stress protein [Halomicroarcula sp. S1AR25-4]|uniref:universal stress protein n=1 Tax=Haloarcula sp. S1AR25-4 TaxID=2950538 RepID=UPI002874D545|nr:universal stress protein [Halomicroarcula sp. S1AR25-4]MDS0276699.1 universal stress protein [Halomicroarcula sp. S1AR25-4]
MVFFHTPSKVTAMDLSFDTIVLAIGPADDDRLDQLARVSMQVAKPTGATVVLTHVFTRDEFDEVAAELDYPSATAEDVDVILERHQSVTYLEDRFDDHGVDYEVDGVVGNVSDGIVKTAEKADADRVVISGGSRSPVGKAVFGSNAQNVLINSPCPVTYVRPQSD